jgi:FdhD protein
MPRAPSITKTISGQSGADKWEIAVETAVEINLNDAPVAVMMATPEDLEDLAVGFCLTEGILTTASPTQVAVVEYVDGIVANLIVDEQQVNYQAIRKRNLEGRSGCGLCGVDTLAAAAVVPGRNPSADPHAIADASILRAFGLLSQLQTLNQATHTTHAAAWCSASGDIQFIREDVGRHNALDKVAGVLVRDGRLGEAGFLLTSSRMSFELVCKAGVMGAALLASASAPTSLALEIAERIELPVACLGGDHGVVRFNPR